MKAGIKVEIQNFQQLMKQVESIEGAAKKTISATVKDIKSRAPSWVAQEVVKEYNIKKGDIVPSKNGKSKKIAAKIKVYGETIDNMVLIYKGRRLTYRYFSFSPKKPAPLTNKFRVVKTEGSTLKLKGAPAAKFAMVRMRKPYNIFATVRKNKKEKLKGEGSGLPFLAPVKTGNYLPFQMHSHGISPMRGPSVPEMIDSPEVRPRIDKRIREESDKRLKNNIDRFMKN